MGTLHLLLLCLLIFVEPTESQERRCDVPADVIFLMDASDSIKDTEWQQEKDFVSVLIDNLEVARYAIHVGVIVYSTELGQVIDLQPFKTKEQLKVLLQQAQQINQGTDTAKAIARMIDMSEGQGRIEAGAKQIGVIITDGRSTDVAATVREARRARLDRHVTMIALGVGNETFPGELREITGPENSDRLFQVKEFAHLHQVVAQLQELICEIVPATTTRASSTSTTTPKFVPTTSPFIPPFPCSQPADLVFLLDGSYSISPPDWVKGQQFLTYLVNSIHVAPDSVHVAIVVYGSEIGDVVPLQPFKDTDALKSAATSLVQPPVGRTNTALGIQKVRDIFNTQGRSQVPRIAIIVTDGMSSNPSETRDQAALAKSEGISMFVVGVGDGVLRQEIEEMASSPGNLFEAPDFQQLVGLIQSLRDQVCTAIQVTTTTAATTSTPATPTTAPQVPELCKQCLVEGGLGFNQLPSDCEKYVVCLPQGSTYDIQVKACPFGMFWSSVAVSCLDARYVNCPADRCRALPDSATYGSEESRCRSYYGCSNGSSVPHCCQPGFRYMDRVGCSPDPTCLDPCLLNVTIYNQGACGYRQDPGSYYRYLEVIPGQGHVTRQCAPGQVYKQADCGCTFDARDVIPDMACSPAVNLTFDGHWSHSQPISMHHVDLTDSGTAYFNGDSSLTILGSSDQDFGNQILIKFKFRTRRNGASDQGWNNHGDWAFQHWFSKAGTHGNTPTVLVGEPEAKRREVLTPKGAQKEPLEVITISKNGTVIRDPNYNVNLNTTWPTVIEPIADRIMLGGLANLTSPTIVNGIVYVPIGNQKVLVHDHSGGGPDSATAVWKIVAVTSDGQSGQIVETGQGSVPVTVQDKHGFDLRPTPTERWFILAPRGVVLQHGEGSVPEDVINRYAGFTSGLLVKVFERGEALDRWQVSRTDGSQLQEGRGEMPGSLVSEHQLDTVLAPRQATSTWTLLTSDGTILESGTGDLPPGLSRKYSSHPSVIVVKATSKDGREPYWEISRPSGLQILQGRGSLPQGVIRFIQGDVPSPQIATVHKWTVTMPDGTVRHGTGQISQELLDLFQQMKSPAGKIHRPHGQLVNKWSVTLPNGTVQSGQGQIPEDLRLLMSGQETGLDKRWQVTLPDGTVRSGVGDMPPELWALLPSRRKRQAADTRMDIVSNCEGDPATKPSVHVWSTDRDVTFTLITSPAPSSSPIDLSLPITAGMNDVIFTYDGSQLTGSVNGFFRTLPVSGRVETRPSPLVVGGCRHRPGNRFVGEIDENMDNPGYTTVRCHEILARGGPEISTALYYFVRLTTLFIKQT